MFGLCALCGLVRSARVLLRLSRTSRLLRLRSNCASPGTIQRSIELLYYRTSVPSNERLVREANVTATVAERGGKARAIRNRSPLHVQPDSRQANLRTPSPVPKAGAPGEGRRNHLRLVADHGRVIDPAFIPRQGATPGGPVPKREGKDAPQRVTPPRGEAQPGGRRTAGRRPAASGRRPVRLTRRGRLVVTSTIVLLIAIACMAVASAAQAAGHP
jgi:hypothetical protein